MLKKIKTLNIQKFLQLTKLERPVIILAAISLVLLANFVFSVVPLRLDLSRGKAYTLSNSTKNVLKKTKDTVDITFFVSSDIPTKLLPLRSEVTDLLNEYKRQSKKVKLTIVDPKKNDKAASKAKELGVPELQFSQLEKDNYNVTASMFGIAIQYGNKKEIIPQATETGSLEYSLTSAIYRLTRNELPKVGIVGLEQTQGNQISSLVQILQQQVSLESTDISSVSAQLLDASTKAVLVFDTNQKQYTDDETSTLKNYINKGGNVLFFADGVWVPSGLNGSPTPAQHNLFSLIKEYGITLNKNLILSSSYELVNFGNDVVSFVSPYPYWIKAGPSETKSANFSNISHLTLPWASSVTLGKKNGYEVESLVNTVKQSWEQTKDFTLFPQNIKKADPKNYKVFNLVARSVNKKGGGIVVIPSSRFVNEEFVQRGNDNVEFTLNIIDDLVSGGALSGIRHRQTNFYSLPNLSDTQKDMFKYSTILLLPLLFTLYGAMRLTKRK